MQQQPSVPGNRKPIQPPIPEPAQRRRKKKSFMQILMDNYIPNKKDSKRDLIRKSVLILAVVILIGSLIYIASYYGESSNNKQRTSALADLFSGTGDADYKVSNEYEKMGYLKKFWPLYELNEDVAGWIEIEGTQVNYAVVQGDDNKYYERRDFDRKDNQHGVPFVDFRVDLKKPSTNTVIYAHNMNDGQMFGELLNYKSLAYYKEHPVVNFDSVYAEGKYKVAAIVLCKKDDPDYNYHNFIDAKNGAELDAFMKKTKERSLINTTVDVKEGDSLITLSTCDYSFKDPVTNDRIARFVVIARKVREGESSTVDTSGAKLNPNPILPAEWATYLKKQQAAELKRQEEEAANNQYADIRKEAAKWFTADELSGIADEKLEAEIAARKELMMAYLTADELENLTAKEKLALLKERQDGSSLVDLAFEAIRGRSDLQWMTEDEMFSFAQQLAKYNKERWENMMNEKAQEAGNVEINLSDSALKGVSGDTYELSVSVDGSTERPRFRSDNKSVATVDQNGVVTFLKPGTATITVTVGGRTVSCVVTVEGEESESKPESKPESEPESSKPESEVSKPSSKPQTPSSKPETPSTKPETPSSKPETPSTKPETPSTKPETPSSKPETPSSKPETPSSKPETPVTPPTDPVTPPTDPVTPPTDPVTPPTDPVTPPTSEASSGSSVTPP